ncbi:MAG: type I phosphomannose isomerase catalytic subunit, partial [Candidatus Gallimonas sp.]
MLKLQPVLKDYLWGGKKLTDLFGRKGGEKIAESWEVSVHPDGESKCAGGTLSAYLKENPCAVDRAGSPFPVLIKYIDAKQNLSVQVHPDDEYARREEGDNGKTEMWYIVQADEGAGIYCGFRRDTSKEEFLRKVQDGTVEDLLNFIPVKAGDCYLIEAGTVHAIGAGCVICEIQQSSNVTYRVYDYNRRDANGNLRPLHIQKAMEVINFRAFEDGTGRGDYRTVTGGKIRLLTECKYFRCSELLLDGTYADRNARSFVTVNVLEGKGTINGQPYEKGDAFFLPCGEKLELSGTGKCILTENHEKKYYVGIDLGGTFVKCGIVDEDGNILAADKIPTGVERPYGEVIADMANLAKRLETEAGVAIRGVGVGSPGMIDSENGVVRYSNNFGWRNVPLVA